MCEINEKVGYNDIKYLSLMFVKHENKIRVFVYKEFDCLFEIDFPKI